MLWAQHVPPAQLSPGPPLSCGCCQCTGRCPGHNCALLRPQLAPALSPHTGTRRAGEAPGRAKAPLPREPPHPPERGRCSSRALWDLGAGKGPTIGVVLHVVEVNVSLPPVLLQQVTLGATQVDSAALRGRQALQPLRVPNPSVSPHPKNNPKAQLVLSVTSSQFCSSFTQNLARWKLLLLVRSGREVSGPAPGPRVLPRPTATITDPEPSP